MNSLLYTYFTLFLLSQCSLSHAIFFFLFPDSTLFSLSSIKHEHNFFFAKHEHNFKTQKHELSYSFQWHTIPKVELGGFTRGLLLRSDSLLQAHWRALKSSGLDFGSMNVHPKGISFKRRSSYHFSLTLRTHVNKHRNDYIFYPRSLVLGPTQIPNLRIILKILIGESTNKKKKKNDNKFHIILLVAGNMDAQVGCRWRHLNMRRILHSAASLPSEEKTFIM